MRDKLIDLLEKKYDHYCDQCGVNKDTHYIENLADYLIANGVTFADVPDNNVGKWIPTSERLPTLDDAAEGRVWAILKGERPDMWSYITVRIHPEDFVCWMSIPKPPKEGEG
jgi:hypothetical protein